MLTIDRKRWKILFKRKESNEDGGNYVVLYLKENIYLHRN